MKKNVMRNKILIFSIIFSIIPQLAFAYIGPGLALGTIVLTLGIVGVLLLAIVAILYYPIKKVIKNAKLRKLKKNK